MVVFKYGLNVHRTAVPIDHPDGSVTRVKLESIESSLLYMLVKGSYFFTYKDEVPYRVFAFDKVYADKMIYMVGNSSYGEFKGGCAARVLDYRNYYWFGIATNYSTADSRLSKIVNGTVTNLAYEAVDLGDASYTLALSISGSALKAFRIDMATPKLSVTDTSFASGYWGHSESGSSSWASHAFLPAIVTAQLRNVE